MSHFGLSQIDCNDLQIDLDRVFGAIPPGQVGFVPLLMFMMSESNRSFVADLRLPQLVNPGDGKIRDVEFIWTPRYELNEVSTTIGDSCAAGNTAGEDSTICSVDPAVGVQVRETYNITTLATRCESNQDWLAKRWLAMMDGARRQMERQVATQLLAAAGGFADDDRDFDGTDQGIPTDIKQIATLVAGGGSDLRGLEALEYTLATTGAGGLYTFGGYLSTTYFRRLEAGCCLTTSGVDMLSFFEQGGIRHSRSIDVDAVVTDTNEENFIGLIPGAAHLAYFNLYDGPVNKARDDAFWADTLIDPVLGLPWDATFTRDCKNVTLALELPFNVCTMPTDYFSDGDEMAGVNGIFEFDINNP